jgi:hypothetical protein
MQVCRKPDIAHTYRSDAAEHAMLAERFARFRALYPALHGVAKPGEHLSQSTAKNHEQYLFHGVDPIRYEGSSPQPAGLSLV